MFNNFNFFKNEVESEEELRDKEKRVAWSYKVSGQSRSFGD